MTRFAGTRRIWVIADREMVALLTRWFSRPRDQEGPLVRALDENANSLRVLTEALRGLAGAANQSRTGM